jgi:hypothetical protein
MLIAGPNFRTRLDKSVAGGFLQGIEGQSSQRRAYESGNNAKIRAICGPMVLIL